MAPKRADMEDGRKYLVMSDSESINELDQELLKVLPK
jgi:hypothetical protein